MVYPGRDGIPVYLHKLDCPGEGHRCALILCRCVKLANISLGGHAVHRAYGAEGGDRASCSTVQYVCASTDIVVLALTWRQLWGANA
jgi:hypothetical protein